MTTHFTHRVRAGIFFAAAFAISGIVVGCTDKTPTAPDATDKGGAGTFDKSSVIAAVACHASVKDMTVTCADPVPASPAGGSSERPSILLGGQNNFVAIHSTNVGYNSGTGAFTFDVTIRNLIAQTLGLLPDLNADPNGIRIFFASGPTVTGGSGLISVVGDGTGTFTGPNQPYYQYSTTLATFAITSAKTWNLNMPPTVTSFDFTLLVSAEVPAPNGYIDLDVQTLRPPTDRQMSYVVRNANGTVDPNPGPLNWSVADPSIITVDGTGLINPLRAGTTLVTCTAGTKVGTYSVTVLPITRTWLGTTSADWNDGANWSPDAIKPGPTDTALVSDAAGPPNYPTLSQNESVGGVIVSASGGSPSINLGAFDLSSSGNVTVPIALGIANSSGRLFLTGTAKTVEGKLPTTRVTGTYSMTNNVTLRAPMQVDAGRLTASAFRLQGESQ